MTDRRFSLLDAATVVVVVALAAVALGVAIAGPTTPLPMHFDLQGRPDRWGDRAELAGVIGFMTAMAALTSGMMGWYARKSDDPARRRGLAIGQGVSLLGIGGTAVVVLASILGHDGALGRIGSTQTWSMALVGLLLAVIGAFLGRVAPNPVVGVRTPWNFKSRLAWDRSNRLAGRLLFWLGLLAMVAAPVSPQPAGMIGLVVAVLIAAAWSVVESWRVWRTDPDRQPF